MEKLIERQGLKVYAKFKGDYGSQNILQRLADFEDIGLEPKEIEQLKENYEAERECSDKTAKNWAESSKALKTENAKLKSQLIECKHLLKLAMEDMAKIATTRTSCSVCFKPKYREICGSCNFRWRHANKAEKILEEQINERNFV
ncbi:MAG: hypothetical protein K2F81_00615 [Ruminococcus sp.]|nr:hypothetical protein [Ruminococcus sp.]